MRSDKKLAVNPKILDAVLEGNITATIRRGEREILCAPQQDFLLEGISDYGQPASYAAVRLQSVRVAGFRDLTHDDIAASGMKPEHAPRMINKAIHARCAHSADPVAAEQEMVQEMNRMRNVNGLNEVQLAFFLNMREAHYPALSPNDRLTVVHFDQPRALEAEEARSLSRDTTRYHEQLKGRGAQPAR